MNLTAVLEIIDRVKRSWWTVIAGICLGLASATVALHYMPKLYEAHTTIFVVPPQMPESLVPSTVTDDMSTRLSALQEAVISRTYMLQLIAETYGEIDDPIQLESLIHEVGSRVLVSLMRIDPRRGGGVFQLSYSDSDAERAANVVNTLARLYIDQNVQFRTNQAQDTTNTIKELADEVEVQLRTLEQQIATFKERHLYDTSEHFDANLQQMSASRQELEANGRTLAQARDSLQTLLIQQEQVEWMATSMPDSVQSTDPQSAQYLRLKGELADLRARYQEDHPDVRRKKKELDDFIAANAALFKDDGGGEGQDPEMNAPTTPLMAQIETSRREITRLEGDAVRIQRDIDEYKRRIERTPQVDQELSELTKNLGVLRDKYRGYLEKYEDARAALRIEESQQGERFEIIEQAMAPRMPSKPVPRLVYSLCLFGGLCLLVGPIVLKYFLTPIIDSESGLRELSEFPILITLGQLQTPNIERMRRKRRFKNLLASVLAIASLAVVEALFLWKIPL